MLLLASEPTRGNAALIAHYDFVETGLTVSNLVPSASNYDISVRANSASFADANAFGSSTIGTLLGRAGLVTEPVEPTSQDNNYGFWAPKQLLMPLSDWTVLMWFNRRVTENDDFLFYVGTGDGFSGTGAEIHVFATAGGSLAGFNYPNNSVRDWSANGGQVQNGLWHQAGIVKSGSTMSLYLDGELIDSTPNVSLNAFNSTANSFIVFGAAKWMRLPGMRTRVFDGMIDQIEVYDEALATTQIVERYEAIAVPEPASSVLMGMALIGFLTLFRRYRG